MVNDRTIKDLHYLQSLPLDMKIELSKARIREWVSYYGVNGVYISFSGGKDSTVLLHLARSLYTDLKAVFVDTGLEYPEIKSFVKSFDNVDIIRPRKTFKQVICDYGYPFISKEISRKIYYYRKGSAWAHKYDDPNFKPLFTMHKYIPLAKMDFFISDFCCTNIKKKPVHDYATKNHRFPLTAQTAVESMLRTQQWLKNGCNGFNLKYPVSNPLSFWLENDILQYALSENLSLCSVYGDICYQDIDGQQTFSGCGSLSCTGCSRTGCIFCGYGTHLEKGLGRFELLHQTHPHLYNYCMFGGAYDDFGVWKPDNTGLGMAHCIDCINEFFGYRAIKC